MKIRYLQSLLVCTITLWKSSLTGDDWISGGLASLIVNWCCNLCQPHIYLFHILTQKWELSSLTDQIRISIHVCLIENWSWLLIQAQFPWFLESILLELWSWIVSVKSVLAGHWTKLSKNHQCVLSWNTVPLQQHEQILLPCRIYSLCFLVKVIWFVLRTVAIEFDDVKGFHSEKERLP